jgi:hypothetical protein
MKKLIGREMIGPLPQQIWQGKEDDDANAGKAEAGPENAALGADQKRDEKGDKKKDSGVLVLNAQPGQQTKE